MDVHLPRQQLARRLEVFLEEDLGFGDLTTELLLPPEMQAKAWVKAKERGIVAGVQEAVLLFELEGVEVAESLSDGGAVEPGDAVIAVKGPAKAILGVERTALNILARMSGIATATRRMVEKLDKAGYSTRVAATRKTAPGLRYFDKRAVSIGGGDTHRTRLDDAVLIKDNHLALLGSVSEAVTLARKRASFTRKIEVEVKTPAEAVEAALAHADIIMLDNMAPSQVAETMRDLQEEGAREKVLVEASGGVTEENVLDYARLGVDIVSVGALTHSSKAMDLSLDIGPIREEAT